VSTVAPVWRRLENRFYAWIRPADASLVPDQAATRWDPATVRGHKYCLLMSRRRDGEMVGTPVWFGLADGGLYFRTDRDTGKVRRIRRDPAVLVAMCGARGHRTTPFMAGRARILDDDGARRAEAALQEKYGWGRRVYQRFFASRDAVYVEVTSAEMLRTEQEDS
jgi:PPOX class probable F420-dependent enzyme